MLQKVQANHLDCYHCGLAIAAGDQFCAELDGVDRHFCCPACREVACTIIASGLSSFYQFRTDAEQAPNYEDLSETFSAFDDQEFQQRYVQLEPAQKNPIASTQLLIGGIHCAACVWLLEQYLQQLSGIEQVTVSLSEQKASIRWQPQQLSLSRICSAIARLGYQPEPYSQNHLQDMQQRENHQALRRLGVAGIGMMQVGMFAIALHAGALQSMATEYRDYMRWVSLLVATPVVLYSARPFFVGAWRGLKMKKPGMDLPVAIAIGLAYLASVKATALTNGEVYYDSVTMFTFLLLAGRYLEMRARHFSGRLSTDLNSLLPATAVREDKNGAVDTVALFKLRPGDKLIVKPGQVIAADGVVIDGHSAVNESQMTGEFNLQTKNSGDLLLAGTINGSGAMTMLVQATGADLQLQSINSLLIKAQQQKPLLAQAADKLAAYFVSGVLLVAAMTFIYWQYFSVAAAQENAFWIMLSVLVVSCPCALSLATPAALTAATSRLRRCGLLVTSANVWQKMPAITDVVCDKTGTLTRGELIISDVRPLSSLSVSECMAIAISMERHSEHPIAKAFTASAEQQVSLTLSNITISHGQGIEADSKGECYRLGNSDYVTSLLASSLSIKQPMTNGQWLLLADSQSPLCWFRLEDSLRDDAEIFVSTMQQRGLKLHLLSGDSSSAVAQLGEKLGMDYCVAGASPKQKLDYIQGLQSRGAKVLMLGDGINDLPVLAAADISVAMVNASNLAKTHADSILLTGRLCSVLTLMDLAVKTGRTIKQNIFWALGYNLLAIPVASMGLVAPYLAAIGMSLSSLVVVINALRLQSGGQVATTKNSFSIPASVKEAVVNG